MFNDLQFALGRKLKPETLIQVKNSPLLERGMVNIGDDDVVDHKS